MNTIKFTAVFLADAVLLRFWQIDIGSKLILASLAMLAWAGAATAARDWMAKRKREDTTFGWR